MLENARLYSFNFFCPEIQETAHSVFNNVKGRSYYARFHKKRNPHGHQALLLTGIPGDKERLQHYGLHSPITFDYLDLTPEESLPHKLNPCLMNNEMVFNLLSIFRSSIFSDEQWLAMFTLEALSDSMRTNEMQSANDISVRTVHKVFKETIEQYPQKKVLVINFHGGQKPLKVGERYGTIMPIRNMLRNLRSNLRQFSEGQPFKEKYSCVLLLNCDPEGDVLPDYLGRYLGVKVFHIVGKAGQGTDYPTFVG